ncbi:FecCD family ABC transporter permease [Paracoccus denitrificans]|jgi:iron complex transport system permease protein|uniref:Transport system permease protein n=1 Tax=Paracoccus denitrificans (strain Pd 1222) TaxID=318586 RepID=A1B9S4_PARDP|nr:iron ABC transporter permease [Paracoccus denitrificans]ABL72268.1 transport system permease protein [Paracoccus denitrificans PD1222]MBB4625812.1 iron complex transport system permease protein [Paracoccus denitrificans]MCU7427024.1 iron ABC transporter permease [Paracoccus denitrificans]QAR28839.1 iron ABC transporter permease [Paracoccus denitrificans]UPV96988.1 iron ABC transporter permease [Paracoccus denitrificans]
MVAVTPDLRPERLEGDRSHRARRLGLFLALLLAVVAVISLGWGASGTSLTRAVSDLMAGRELAVQDRVVLMDIRLPRVLMGIFVGASLAVSGAVMQGLFRNPLADPGIVGVSSGASLGAILAIVLGSALPAGIAAFFGWYLVPVAAFAGGWLTTIALYRIATRRGRTSVATMLLAGIALAAIMGALSGVVILRASDRELRDLTFWGLGSLAGANWPKLLAGAPIMALALLYAPWLARGLNALALGEAAAGHVGIRVQKVKNRAILTVAAATGAAVAVSGGIGFVGIVVPHLLRLASGPDHRWLLVNSALLGAVTLLLADMVSRTVIAPAELPIGIVTAIMGGPFFLWILLRNRGVLDL